VAETHASLERRASFRAYKRIVAPAAKEARCDELLNGGIADIDPDRPEPPHLPLRQAQSRHLPVLGADAFDKLTGRPFNRRQHSRMLARQAERTIKCALILVNKGNQDAIRPCLIAY
jgi:hypothetical protein